VGRGVVVLREGKEAEKEEPRVERGYRFLCWEPPTWEGCRSHSLPIEEARIIKRHIKRVSRSSVFDMTAGFLGDR